MTTVLHPLAEDSEEYELLHDLVKSIYLDGECYALAIALHRALGWPIIGLMDKHDIIRHAVVKTPDGRYLDARGFVSEATLHTAFGQTPYPLKEITEEMLFAAYFRPNMPEDNANRIILQAQRFAEKLWPHLPWNEPSLPKVLAFTDALEALCREHGFWIRSQVPGCPPILCEGDGEEAGYDLRQLPTLDHSFLIDRSFGT